MLIIILIKQILMLGQSLSPFKFPGDVDVSGNLIPLTYIKFADIANVVVPMWHEKAAAESFEPNEASPSFVIPKLD